MSRGLLAILLAISVLEFDSSADELEASENISGQKGSAGDEPLDNTSRPRLRPDSQVITGVPISCGIVVIGSRVLDRPYVVSRSGQRLFVNGTLIAVASAEGTPEPANLSRMASRIEKHLLGGGSVLGFGQTFVACFVEMELGELIAGLLKIDEAEDRALYLAGYGMEGAETATTAEWRIFAEAFEPNSRLMELVDEYHGYIGEMGEADGETPHVEDEGDSASRIMYGLSIVGMLLIAVSAGTLIGHPPKSSTSWSQIVRSRRTICSMQRCLILIAAYSAFDLAATLLASRTGQFEELNPLGATLLLAPLTLALFKVTATCLGTGLLWRLKDYHGAQLASWWLCMILTLVTVRWVTVQSLFFV